MAVTARDTGGMTTTENESVTPVQIGAARSQGPSLQEMHAQDTRPVPESLLDHSYVPQGDEDVPRSRYFDPGFAALENEYLWTNTWQMACMEVDLQSPGDHVVYDVADQSLIVTRTKTGDIKAFHNACLHRGTKLRVDDGRVASFRCPFHGWRWSTEGELVELPANWDFPQVWQQPDSCLPEAHVATWQGFVFVNMAADPIPFETYADKLIEHFGRDFRFTERYRAFHAVKEVPANWKVCMEAFGEGYHVIATHPQILEFTADENSEYSIWPDSPFVTRFVNGFGLQSPHLEELSDQQVVDAYIAFSVGSVKGKMPEGSRVEVPDGVGSRAVVAEVFRNAMSGLYGADLSDRSDTEMLDATLYHLFPAFAPWAGVGQSLVYRWRPGPTPDTCFMDVIRMAPLPDSGEIPEPAPIQRLTLEQTWHEAEGMRGLADVFAQDMANLPRVQAGLKSTGKRGVSFGLYQETRMRMHHRLVDRFIDDGLRRDGRSENELDPWRVPGVGSERSSG
jgi:phenylpropionate dioxygenase-like ring-hydroxylating dioxygenase large terminal subunit